MTFPPGISSTASRGGRFFPLIGTLILIGCSLSDNGGDFPAEVTSSAIYSRQDPSTQVDRVGYPGVEMALLPSDLKTLYNSSGPGKDFSTYKDFIIQSMMAYGSSSQTATLNAAKILPGVQRLDISKKVEFPNGRPLEQDVGDYIILQFSGGTRAGDGVRQNDKSFSSNFPFLADPH